MPDNRLDQQVNLIFQVKNIQEATKAMQAMEKGLGQVKKGSGVVNAAFSRLGTSLLSYGKQIATSGIGKTLEYNKALLSTSS